MYKPKCQKQKTGDKSLKLWYNKIILLLLLLKSYTEHNIEKVGFIKLYKRL